MSDKDFEMDRRLFFSRCAGGSTALLLAHSTGGAVSPPPAPRPNILWISAEDISPMLGCYGDDSANTPHLDALAAEGIRYTNAFTHAGVCAPVRSGLITGMYPSSIGSHHMRSRATLPGYMRLFPAYLRDSGYYCSNNAKEDYNLNTPTDTWDDSSRKAHWRNRATGQPFFSVFNLTVTHESVNHFPPSRAYAPIEALPDAALHDPAKVRIPAYHPDTPEMRKDWARYYDAVSVLDGQVGEVLDQLKADGLEDDTIVMFWGDHGTGMPRCKRWIYDSGTRVPLIIRLPKRWRHLSPIAPGETEDRLVSFVDLAPTLLHLSGSTPPEHFQGQPFLGAGNEARRHVFFIRDRMDSRYDCIRGVFDGHYRYLRNFNPHVPYNQRIPYLFKAAGMRSWQALADAGKLAGPPSLYMAPRKPLEELYDTAADPDEVNNLAEEPRFKVHLDRLRQTLYQWMIETRDLGLLDEAEMHTRAGGQPEHSLAQDHDSYDLERILDTADLSRSGNSAKEELLKRTLDVDSAVRYWGAVGLMVLAADGGEVEKRMTELTADENVSVRIAAAQACKRLGLHAAATRVALREAAAESPWVRLRAVALLEQLAEKSDAARDMLATLRNDENRYVAEVAKQALE